MRRLAASLALSGFLALSGCAGKVYLPKTPQYDPSGGEIIFRPWKNVRGGAQADYSNGFPIVFYDPAVIGRYPEEFQKFIFHHEVGHIKKGHISLENHTVLEPKRAQTEWEADCYSLDVLRNKSHYTSEQMFTVYEFADIFLEDGRAEGMLRCTK